MLLGRAGQIRLLGHATGSDNLSDALQIVLGDGLDRAAGDALSTYVHILYFICCNDGGFRSDPQKLLGRYKTSMWIDPLFNNLAKLLTLPSLEK